MSPDAPDGGAAPAANLPGGPTAAGEDPAATELRLRKLRSRASQLKLDLHDLAEDLPIGWEGLLDVARRTYDAYAEIALLEGLLQKETSG